MPDEAQHLTAAKPESDSAAAAKPAPSAPHAKNDTRGTVEHTQSAPVDKSAEQSRPKPAPPEGPASAPTGATAQPAVRPNTGQPARSGSSNRVRARLARLGVQRSNPYNPVLEPLLRIVRSNDPKIETATLRQIEKAYQVAERWHRGQKRKSGDPYITHPLAVTTILAELGMDPATLMAGLLHDTVEDTEYGLDQLRRDFGDAVALLVDGVTKLDKVKFGEAAQAETVRKMVVAMAKDPRVLVIKLADRLHNMRTMRYLKREKQEKKARETLEIYAPLAHRLGMNTIKWELEDLAFAILYPKMYDEIVRLVAERAPKRDEYLAIVTDEVQQDLRAARIKATVTGRPKHYYSVYQKMIVRGRDFAEIYDLVGIRVLVDTVRDCYAALGTVHARWNPVPGRFKDYIAMPKFNMYQSLHTTVIGPNGKPVELQIRTFDMHRRAEYGIAAHWKYKQEAVAGASKVRTDVPKAGKGKDDHLNDMAWLRQLLDWQKETEDPGEFLESLRFDLSRNEVFVFTPKGDVIALPAGATPVDFAYAVHTEVGHRTIGARVNGRLVPLESTLDNGDLVEVFTSKAAGAGPSRDWLGFVKSPRARNKIRAWFSKERRDEAIEQGKDAIVRAMRKQNLPIQRILTGDSLVTLAHEMRYADISALYAAIGEGHVSAQNIVQKLVQALGGEEAATEEIDESVPPTRSRSRKRRSSADPGVIVKGVEDVWVKLARCCTPVPGDPIIGFVTRGSGVSVHRSDCVNVESLSREPERILDVEWAPTQSSVFLVAIQVEALDRSRLLSDVTRVLSDQHVNILSAAVQTSRDRVATSRFTFEMGDPKHLGHVLKAVRGVEGVYDVYRVTSARSRS
ncbi:MULTISPECIES: RelA/SpoT family protein [Streptomyces]|uniref:Bifunctional (P)ppGpp synthetase/guanosine-3',5'-bis(Diphosphate) 3'-pyrophosphohydrolase n=1 Tax=Streptomyces spinosisporus TaxID=2927582 RepID=A0ABS9XQS7_9ACTN|nr:MULTISPECIES: bifunctional (p)ppGpp synthetase/guanosine-3',5'-bis(diphosphate) 3'-pyrophosphohydrolase [Streptomyces]EPD61277.1 GTP pyrophosphokinase [Streptomyces sp. HGB0020]MCI3244383.1 bifunctional (p)ppGpp synthetase/guanosine-3',5'-bis(diphosphate) 3'-pyrophosphohydrolase [Streptomyces spinosisporus]WUB39674.1 bifunctional (p)ppGpp synthetase/guanosine-3',5'-bis(diphosphate) 3'-pyrophosphohydrolase [Streptomyces sp. NBC_00588]